MPSVQRECSDLFEDGVAVPSQRRPASLFSVQDRENETRGRGRYEFPIELHDHPRLHRWRSRQVHT